MMFSLRDAMAVGSIHLSTEFFSLTQGMIQIRQQIEDELVRKHHIVPLRPPDLTNRACLRRGTTASSSRCVTHIPCSEPRLPLLTPPPCAAAVKNSVWKTCADAYPLPHFNSPTQPILTFTPYSLPFAEKKTYTGKTGGRNDDVSVVMQLAIAGYAHTLHPSSCITMPLPHLIVGSWVCRVRIFYSSERYRSFRPEVRPTPCHSFSPVADTCHSFFSLFPLSMQNPPAVVPR